MLAADLENELQEEARKSAGRQAGENIIVTKVRDDGGNRYREKEQRFRIYLMDRV